MGIKGLSQFIKKYYTKELIPLVNFSNKYIAIDSNQVLYAYHCTSYKTVISTTNVQYDEPDIERVREITCERILHFIDTMKKYNICPIFVFDGQHSLDKKKCQDKRKENKEKYKNQLCELKKELSDLKGKAFADTSIIISKIQKIMCSICSLNKDDIDFYKKYIFNNKCTTLNAPDESEKLCVELVKSDIAHFVYSSDTDVLAMGCPILSIKLKEDYNLINGNECLYSFECYNLNDILQKLDVTYTQFLDFCIMCGCDFNTNIRGIGPVRCFKIIKEFKSYENFTKNTDKDVSVLKYDICKKLLSTDSLNMDLFDVIEKYS